MLHGVRYIASEGVDFILALKSSAAFLGDVSSVLSGKTEFNRRSNVDSPW